MYIISDEERDRIKIVKLIAIILVVYLHSYETEVNFSDGTRILYLPIWLQVIEDGLSQLIAQCAVPIFFLISSILLFKSNRPYGVTIKKKVRTLLLPYLIWNTFWILVFLVLQSLPFTTAYFSGKLTPILQCSVIEWFGLYGIGEMYPQCYPLWFMRDMMVVLIFYPIIKSVVNFCPKIMLCVGVTLTLIPLNFFGKTALAWFIIGAAIVKMQIHLTFLDSAPMLGVFGVYLVFAVITYLAHNRGLRGVFIFIGIAFWLRLSKEIYAREHIRKIFIWLSQWTFMIYVFHELTLASVKKVCLRILPTSPLFLLLEYLLIPVFIIMACIIVGIIFKRIAPKLYMFSTGER